MDIQNRYAMKGLKIWVMTEIMYDEYGNATILRSFSKPSKDSPIHRKEKKPETKKETEIGETILW